MNTSTNLSRFEAFKNNGFSWKSRSVWHGKSGKENFNRISVVNFNKETDAFSNIDFKNTNDFYNKTVKLAIDYSDWCANYYNFDDESLTMLKMHFIGFTGEFFFYNVFTHKGTLTISSENSNFTFYNIAPRLSSEVDFGIDLTGCVTCSKTGKSYDCGFQVKFWSPYKNAIIGNDICQKAHSDAVENKIIDNDDDNNIVICWLGNMKKISFWINQNPVSRHFIFVDKKVLKENIDFDTEFWNQISKEIANI